MKGLCPPLVRKTSLYMTYISMFINVSTYCVHFSRLLPQAVIKNMAAPGSQWWKTTAVQVATWAAQVAPEPGVVPFWKKNTAEGMCCCWCSLDQSKAPLWMLAGTTAPFSAVQGSTYCMQIQRATWNSNLFSTYMLHMYMYAYCICIYRSTYIIVINTQTSQKKLQLCKRSEIPFCEISHTNYIPTPSMIIFWNTFRLCFLIHAMWVFLHQKHTQIQKFWCQMLYRAELLMFANWFFFPWNTGSAWRGK